MCGGTHEDVSGKGVTEVARSRYRPFFERLRDLVSTKSDIKLRFIGKLCSERSGRVTLAILLILRIPAGKSAGSVAPRTLEIVALREKTEYNHGERRRGI